MKKIILSLLLNFFLALTAVNFSFAQTPAFFGTCYWGGVAGKGTIFQSDINGNNLHAIYSFLGPEGAAPSGKIAQAPNGKIYGITIYGGCSDSCTLYEYDPIADTCINVYDFYCNAPISESSPAGLIILADGNLYGLESAGIIYTFNPNTHVYTLLHQDTTAGYAGGLMQASDGALYGVSNTGGINNVGFIFRYDLTSNIYTVLYNFDGANGASPYWVNLIQASDGKLYGTTYNGGANLLGVIFSYDITSNVYTDVFDFDVPSGFDATNGVIQASNGKLYGVTYQGGSSMNGVIYSYDISTSQYSVLHNFGTIDGRYPAGGLTQASNGTLFGTTYYGGLGDSGVVFSFDIVTNTYTKLFDCTVSTGYNPQGEILEGTTVTTAIASVKNSSTSIYIDQANQLIVRSSEFGDKAAITMYDAQGKNVFQSEIRNQKSEFDLSSYQWGIYFVQLKTCKEINTQKVILSK